MKKVITKEAFIRCFDSIHAKRILEDPSNWFYSIVGKTKEENDSAGWGTRNSWYEEVNESEY